MTLIVVTDKIMHIVIIEIKNKITKLILKDGKKTLDEVVFADEENISEKLLPNFDALIKKNKLTLEDIESVEVDTDLGDTFTSRRIAKAMKNAFDWTKKNKSQKA
jgi:tRNA A37 threonylcarbamoyladenosine modification protein TsaB